MKKTTLSYFFILSFVATFEQNVLAKDVLSRTQACPDILSKRPLMGPAEKNHACPLAIAICKDGFDFQIPRNIFAETGTYKIKYTFGMKTNECLIYNDGETIDYGCKATFPETLRVIAHKDTIMVDSYHADLTALTGDMSSYIYKYPRLIDLKVFKDKKILLEKNIKIKYETVVASIAPFCGYEVCCNGTEIIEIE